MKRVGIIADCQQLFFMNENAPITLQNDASDYEIGGYLFQTVDGTVQVIMCISKALRWSDTREKSSSSPVLKKLSC